MRPTSWAHMVMAPGLSENLRRRLWDHFCKRYASWARYPFKT
jgi:hypothetical protein